MTRIAATLFALLASVVVATAQPAASMAERTKGLTRADGFVPFYFDAARGRLLLEIPAFDTDVLYYVSIAQGAGSVEMSLDRGIVGTAVIHFVRAGGRVLVEQQNLDYRVLNGTPAMVENVRDSFATSVLAALPVEAEEGGRVLVDGTALFMRDAGGVEGRLRQANQGTFRLDVGRSAFHMARTKAFPRNTEVETVVTFGADQAGQLVNNVTPDGRSFTIRIHHSFLQAPEGYTPRRADPRIGVSAVRFRDYGRPFNESTEVAWVSRFRLQKKDPAAAMSEPVTPIVFYLDLGIPEPTRSAMREGALWWNRAFEAAGYRNAVVVRDPTPDMDPMDIRYPWILWINRDERGFSSGGTYRDPRTGEILGSKTRMDSHRIRTIGNYWEAYSPTTEGGGLDECALFLPVPDFLEDQAQPPNHSGSSPGGLNEMVLLRQALLTAHELGHVFGFGHNWASSANDRASVMEYPTPRVTVRANGTLDLGESFEEGTGAYDAFMTRYAYTEFPEGQEAEGLEAIIREMRAKNILYTPSTDPRWAWYDDRNSPTEYLRETMAARRIMLNQYGPAILRPGEPLGSLRDLRLWMVYLHHRWAIEAGTRYVGGQYHNIAVKGDTLPATAPVPAALQREVLGLLMEALDPANLAMPEALLSQLTPDPDSNLEDMSEDYLFDHLRAARILSALVLGDLLEPARAARLVALSDRDPSTVSLQEVVAAVFDRTWSARPDADARHKALRRVTQRVALDALMMLGAHRDATPEVRAFVLDRLSQLEVQLRAGPHDTDPMTAAHQRQAARDLARYLENPAANAPTALAPNWGARPRSRFPLHPGPPLGGGN